MNPYEIYNKVMVFLAFDCSPNLTKQHLPSWHCQHCHLTDFLIQVRPAAALLPLIIVATYIGLSCPGRVCPH